MCKPPTTPIFRCSVYDSALTCKTCGANYTLSADKKSCNAIVVDNCQEYQKIGVCSFCAYGYVLDGLKCTAIAAASIKANCRDYDATGACIKCHSAYYLSAGSCSLATRITNCAEYSANNKCSMCLPGYIPNAATDATSCTLNAQDVANCLYYAGAGACSQCIAGYYLESASKCTANSATNCQVAGASATTCAVCSEGYSLNTSSNTCAIMDLATNTGVVSNCALYTISGSTLTCTRCMSSSYPVGSPITSCTALTSGQIKGSCAYYDTAMACTACVPGYFLSSGSCVPITIDSCISVDSTYSTKCTKCVQGFYPSAAVNNVNVCVKNSPSAIVGCVVYDDGNACLEYLPNYISSGTNVGVI